MPARSLHTSRTTSRSLTSVALAACLCSGAAHAASFTQGDVTIDINGTVNGFFVNRDVKVTHKTTGAETKTQNSGISNGLLPGWINFVATTKVDTLDIKAHLSFAPGINSGSEVVGLPIGNNAEGGSGDSSPYSQIDTRNVYFQFGNDSWGRVKFGRDIGMFGQQVILSDMTLLGVGGTSYAAIPFNTTFGMIAHGYMYVGFQPQISYSSPNLGGLQLSAGLFQPTRFAGDQTRTPGLQAMATYDWAGDFAGKVWTGLVHQNTSCGNDPCASESFNATGYELGAKAGVGGLQGLVYVFSGKGLGLSTVGAQFLGGGDAAGNRTRSDGHFVQLTYQLGATKLGVNYGKNTDKDGALGAGGRGTNKAFTLGAYHALNKYVTLVGEFNQERKDNAGGSNTKESNRSVSLGSILFF